MEKVRGGRPAGAAAKPPRVPPAGRRHEAKPRPAGRVKPGLKGRPKKQIKPEVMERKKPARIGKLRKGGRRFGKRRKIG